MKPRSIIVSSFALLAASALAFALPAVEPTKQQTKKDPKLEDLSFFAGHWSRSEGGETVEEVWLPARGGFLIGMNRTSSAQGGEFEFLRIGEHEGKLAYLASPGGSKPTPFALKSLEGTKAVFENPAHDFPQMISYERKGDALTATIAGEGGKDAMSWTWKLAAKLE